MIVTYFSVKIMFGEAGGVVRRVPEIPVELFWRKIRYEWDGR